MLKEIIEQSIAMKGDWEAGVANLGEITEFVTLKKWKLIDSVQLDKVQYKLELRRLGSSLIYILGYWINTKEKTKLGIEDKRYFKMIFKINMKREKQIDFKLKYKKIVQVMEVATGSEMQGLGIAKFMYRYIINDLGYSIMGNDLQFFGTRKLYSRLSKELDLNIDIVDLDKEIIVQRDVILHHGDYEDDFDERLWDYEDKEHIRAVITKII